MARREPQGFSAVENGLVGPSLHDQIMRKGRALCARNKEGDMDKAKGMAMALAILRTEKASVVWGRMTGRRVDVSRDASTA